MKKAAAEERLSTTAGVDSERCKSGLLVPNVYHLNVLVVIVLCVLSLQSKVSSTESRLYTSEVKTAWIQL